MATKIEIQEAVAQVLNGQPCPILTLEQAQESLRLALLDKLYVREAGANHKLSIGELRRLLQSH